MTNISVRIEHKNLPLSASSLNNQMTPNEIIYAVSRFKDELPVYVDDDSLTVSKVSKPIKDEDGVETIYFISSSLEREELVSAIERALSSLKLGGHILESAGEINVGF